MPCLGEWVRGVSKHARSVSVSHVSGCAVGNSERKICLDLRDVLMNTTAGNASSTEQALPAWLEHFCTNPTWDQTLFDGLSLTGATPCFEAIVLYGTVGLSSLALSTWYLAILRIRGTSAKRLSGSLYYARLALAAVAVLIPLFLINVLVAQEAFAPYELVSLSLMTLSFMCMAIIVVVERSTCTPDLTGQWVFKFLVLWNATAMAVQWRSFVILGEQTGRHGYYIAMSFVMIISLGLQALLAYFFDAPRLPLREDGDRVDPQRVALYSRRRNESPEESASLYSRLFFTWLSPMISTGYTRPLEFEDLPHLHSAVQCEALVESFEYAWEKEQQQAIFDGRKPSLLRVLRRMLQTKYLTLIPFTVSGMLLGFAGPLLLQSLITYIESDRPDAEGYGLVVAMVLCYVVSAVLSSYAYLGEVRLAFSARAALIGAVFKKSLQLTPKSHMQSSSGTTVNLISSDVDGIVGAVCNISGLWIGPIQIIISMVLLYTAVGPASLAGLGGVFLVTPVMAVCFIKLGVGMQKMLKFSDARVKAVSEALGAMRVIKYYGWEKSLLEKIQRIRLDELNVALSLANVKAYMLLIFNLNPVVLQVVMFLVYATIAPHGMNGPEGAARTFFALSLCQQLIMPLLQVPQAISSFVQANVNLKRLQEFLLLEQTRPNNWIPLTDADADMGRVNDSNRFLAVNMNRPLSFAWDESASGGRLTDIQLTIDRSSLFAIIGQTGSGKSSIVSALLGDMPMVARTGFKPALASIEVHGSVAYAPQIAWIFNATVKDNIVFGRPFHQKRYDEGVALAQLQPDFDSFAAGDATEIGEKGVNLSGGQRQRVSIARALYADADIIVLDDPLSALDAHVGSQVFDGLKHTLCAKQKKTVILVTNQLQFARECDTIAVVHDGKIEEQGSHAALMTSRGLYHDLLESRKGLNADADEAMKPDAQEVATKKKPGKKALDSSSDGTLIADEHRARGVVKWSVVTTFFQHGGGWAKVIPMFLCFILEKAFASLRGLWLVVWSGGKLADWSTTDYVLIFGLIGLTGSVFSLAGNLYSTHIGFRAGKGLHDAMITRIIYAPMSFFDSTPLGRIQNRFSADTSEADNSIQFSLSLTISSALELLGTLIIVGVQTPYALVSFVPIMTLFYYTQAYFRHSSRELKRLDALAQSPLLSHFSETLSGMSTVRAFGAQESVTKEMARRLDRKSGTIMATMASNFWLQLRLTVLGTCCLGAAGIFAVLARRTMSAADVGFTMSYAMTITFSLSNLVGQYQQLENSFNAVERMKEYGELDTEEPGDTGENDNFPTDGSIDVKDLTFAYREGMDPVLKGFTASIKHGEHIGLVGRTGCGKSTFFQALFRINDPVGGTVTVGGRDTQSIGLRKLRSSIGIIPQDPILFDGTLRSNLDPFDEFAGRDQEIWAALEHAHLRELVESTEGGLNLEVSTGGENFSVGQRQLVCLARALLRKTKIIVLDEATANVDTETDALIQKTVRDSFGDRTTLTIAHRLETIMDSDRIIVVEKGSVAEFDSPKRLLNVEGGIFRALVEDTGPSNAEYLALIAGGLATPRSSFVGSSRSSFGVGQNATGVVNPPGTYFSKKEKAMALAEIILEYL